MRAQERKIFWKEKSGMKWKCGYSSDVITNNKTYLTTMKTLFALLVALCMVTPSFADPANAKCPTSGKDVDKAQTSTYTKKVGFCCDKCKAKFDADPAKFTKEVGAYKADSGKCIVSGKDVDAAKSSEFKKEVGFCCPKCKAGFDKDPDGEIVKVK
jgi:YHS domain-containing protein